MRIGMVEGLDLVASIQCQEGPIESDGDIFTGAVQVVLACADEATAYLATAYVEDVVSSLDDIIVAEMEEHPEVGTNAYISVSIIYEVSGA